MSTSKLFHGVSPDIFECMKKKSAEEHDTVYDPADGNQGTATTSTFVGKVVVGFDFEPSAQTITYTIQKKPFIVTVDQIFGGISDTINSCRST